jgi:hypothetical protein
MKLQTWSLAIIKTIVYSKKNSISPAHLVGQVWIHWTFGIDVLSIKDILVANNTVVVH